MGLGVFNRYFNLVYMDYSASFLSRCRVLAELLPLEGGIRGSQSSVSRGAAHPSLRPGLTEPPAADV